MSRAVQVLHWAGQGLIGMAIFVGCYVVVDIVMSLIRPGWRR